MSIEFHAGFFFRFWEMRFLCGSKNEGNEAIKVICAQRQAKPIYIRVGNFVEGSRVPFSIYKSVVRNGSPSYAMSVNPAHEFLLTTLNPSDPFANT